MKQPITNSHALRAQNHSRIDRCATASMCLSALLALQACKVLDPDLLESQEHFATISPTAAMDAAVSEMVTDADTTTHAAMHALADSGTDDGLRARDAQLDQRRMPVDAGTGALEPAATDATDASNAEVACDDDDAGTGDRDGDGLADCIDACPDDPIKSAPGLCGCSHPDSDEGALVSCAGLRDALIHRYGFEGTGSQVLDTRGSLNGVAVGAALRGDGSLELAGDQSDQYVDLPNAMLSGLTNATFEAWVSWDGAGDWTRIFDFGDSDGTSEGSQGLGASYLMLSPYVTGAGTLQAAYAANGPDSAVFVNAPTALPTTGKHHLAVVFDDSNDALRLYLDGMLQGSVLLTGSLSSIHDINNWLGRSQYARDPELGGTLYEFRIYDVALSDDQIALSFASGPNPAFLAE